MDLETELWQQKKLPDLNTARSDHSALGLGVDQVYVACGNGGDGYLKSVEMLRLGANFWELIDIPDLTPRFRPVFSQIDDANNIAILGGYAGRG